MSIYNDHIYHYGVKGMKWGHRKDKGYSYTTNEKGDFVLKKGSNVHRVTDANNEKNEGYEYASFTKKDQNTYKKDFIEYISEKSKLHHDDVVTFEMTQKLTKDLVAPSHVAKTEALLKMLKSDTTLASEIENVYEVKMKKSSNSMERIRDLRESMEMKGYPRNIAMTYSVFAMGMYYSPKLRNKFFKELSDSGYDMMIDSEDAAKYTQSPIIVFNRQDSLKLIKIKELPKMYSSEHDNMFFNKINRDKNLDKVIGNYV